MKIISRAFFLVFLVIGGTVTIGSQVGTSGESPTTVSNSGSSEAKLAAARASKRLLLFKNLKDKPGPPPPESRTMLGITAGKSTMLDVKRVFGPVDVVVTGDGSTNEGSACYRGADGTTAIFTSDEVSPGVGGIELYASSDTSGRTNCSKSEKIGKGITVGPEMRLGMAKVEVHRRLGKPRKVSGVYEVYSWSTQLPAPGQCENNTFYIIEFENEHVTSFQFGSHDSC